MAARRNGGWARVANRWVSHARNYQSEIESFAAEGLYQHAAVLRTRRDVAMVDALVCMLRWVNGEED